MKKSEQVARAEECLAMCESMLTKAIEKKDFEDAQSQYEFLSGGLRMLQWLTILPVEDAAARSDAAFERYLNAKYGQLEEASEK